MMNLQTYRLDNTSFQELPQNFYVAGLSQRPFIPSQNSSFIDLTVPGNRLFQQENGDIVLIPKTPAEVIGEKILRPLIDDICSLTSQLVSKLPDTSSFSSFFLNFYCSSWKPNICPFSENKKKEKVAKICSLRDQALPSSKTLNQGTQRSIVSKSKDLSYFELSKTSVTKAMFAFDRLFTRFIQLLPMASAQTLTKNNEPPPFEKALELTVELVRSIPTCLQFVDELSADEGYKFASNWALIEACNKFVEQKNPVMLELLNFINEYKAMQQEVEDRCLYALRAEKFFNKERELFEKGKKSFFSQSGSEPKIWINQESYSREYIPKSPNFRDPTTGYGLYFDVDLDDVEKEINHRCLDVDKDEALILLENILQSFSTFFSEGLSSGYIDDLGNDDSKKLLTDSTNDTPSEVSILTSYDPSKPIASVHQMQLLLNDASMERLNSRNKEILEKIKQEVLTDLGDKMIEKVQQIENEIIEMLKKDGVVLQDPNKLNSCTKSEPSIATKISHLPVSLSLIGIPLLIVTLYKYLLNQGLVYRVDNSKIAAKSQPVKSELDEKPSVADPEQKVHSPSSEPLANSANHSVIDKLDNSNITTPKTSMEEKILDQLTLKIFTLSISKNEDEKKAVLNLFNDKLAMHDQYNKDRKFILSQLRSMLHLAETPGNIEEPLIKENLKNLDQEAYESLHNVLIEKDKDLILSTSQSTIHLKETPSNIEESRIKENLKNFNCEVCEILHNILVEIAQKPHSSSQEALQSCEKIIPAAAEENRALA